MPCVVRDQHGALMISQSAQLIGEVQPIEKTGRGIRVDAASILVNIECLVAALDIDPSELVHKRSLDIVLVAAKIVGGGQVSKAIPGHAGGWIIEDSVLTEYADIDIAFLANIGAVPIATLWESLHGLSRQHSICCHSVFDSPDRAIASLLLCYAGWFGPSREHTLPVPLCSC